MPRSASRRAPAERIRVMLVDDHPLWRDTLRQILEHAGCTIVATATEGEEAIAAAQESHPDVVVMDVNLPGTDGITATKRLIAAEPSTRVLALSSSDEPSTVVGIVRAGASGYLVKTAGAAEVSDAVIRVHGGELVFPSALATFVLAELRRPGDEDVEPLRVVLADETVLHREGLARLLAEKGLEVVGQADNAADLEEIIESAAPDIAIVDVKIAVRRSGRGRLVNGLRERFPDTSILVLAVDVQTAQVLKLMSGGSAGLGYLLKERVSNVDDVVDAIRRLHRGQPVVDRDVVDRLVERPGRGSAIAALTPREREVLALMAEGRSNQAICERLFLNPKSIESHVRNIFTKLGLEQAPDDHRRVLAVLTFLKAQGS